MSATCDHGTPGCSGHGGKHACEDPEDFVFPGKPKSSGTLRFIPEEKWLKLREFVKGLADSYEGSPPDAARIFRYMRRLEAE